MQEKPEFIVEHDPFEMSQSIKNVLVSTEQFCQAKNYSITSAGLATQRSSFICLKKNDFTPLSNIISWQDRRAHNTMENYKPFAKEIYQRTGLVLNPHYGASKMKWCMEHNHKIKQAHHEKNVLFAPIASYILHEILNEHPFVVDPANGSRTLLMNIKSMQWDESQLNLFSIDADCLPKILLTFASYGNLNVNDQAVPLIACTGDQNAAVFSLGEPQSDAIYVNLGTGAFALNCQSNPNSNSDTGLLKSVLYANNNKTLYATEGTVNGAGRALQWFAEQSKYNNYEKDLEKWITKIADPPIFINGISGVGSPFWIPDLESHFDRESPLEEKFVAVAESIVFLLKVNIDLMLQQQDISKIIISGGLANNPGICQLLANVCKLPVHHSPVTEATALGLFNLINKSTDPQNPTNISQQPDYSPQVNTELEKRYSRWLSMMNKYADSLSSI